MKTQTHGPAEPRRRPRPRPLPSENGPRHGRRGLHRLAPRRSPPRARRPGRRPRRLQRLLRSRVEARQRRRPPRPSAATGWSRATSATARSSSASSRRSASTPSLHLAARAGVRPVPDPARPLRGGQLRRRRWHLLEAAVAHGKPRFVFASSSSVYGDQLEAALRRGRPDRPADLALRDDQARRRAPGLQRPPPPRPAGRLPALLHGLRPPPAPRDGDRPLHPLPRGRARRSPSTATAARAATTRTSTTSSTASWPRWTAHLPSRS